MAQVLIVDDDQAARESLSKLLTAAGHTADAVPNGKDALQRVLAQSPDVIVLDLLMPEMDGPSFLEVIRSYLRLQSLPVVVLTGLEDSPMINRAQALKINSVLIKAKASSDDILQAIKEAVARHPG